MLLRMASCGQSSFSNSTSSKPSERPVASGSADEDTNSSPTSVGHNVLIALSARTIGSLGFGLSILAIWLHWLVPVQSAPSVPPVIRAKAKNRRRSLPSAIQSSSSSHDVTHAIIPLAAPPNLLVGKHNNRTRRVYFADVPSQDIVPSTRRNTVPPYIAHCTPLLPVVETQAPDIPLLYSAPLTPAIPITPVSVPTTPGFTSTLPLEDVPDHQTEFTRHPIRSSNFIPKMPCAFHSRSKRASLPALTDEGSHPSTCVETKKKTSRPFTPPWLSAHSAISSDIEVSQSQVPKSSFARISFQPRSSRSSSLDSNPCNQKNNTTRSSLFTRKAAPRRSNTTPVPRTLPYEAPYYVSPPIPLQRRQTTLEPKHV